MNRVAPLSVNTEASATGDENNDRLLMSQNSGFEEYATIGENKSIYARRPGSQSRQLEPAQWRLTSPIGFRPRSSPLWQH